MGKEIPHGVLTELSHVLASNDGDKVSMRLHDDSGPFVSIEIGTDKIADLISVLCRAAAQNGRNRVSAGIAPPPLHYYPVEADALGFDPIDTDLAKKFPGVFPQGIARRQVAHLVHFGDVALAFRSPGTPTEASMAPAWLRYCADRLEASLREDFENHPD